MLSKSSFNRLRNHLPPNWCMNSEKENDFQWCKINKHLQQGRITVLWAILKLYWQWSLLLQRVLKFEGCKPFENMPRFREKWNLFYLTILNYREFDFRFSFRIPETVLQPRFWWLPLWTEKLLVNHTMFRNKEYMSAMQKLTKFKSSKEQKILSHAWRSWQLNHSNVLEDLTRKAFRRTNNCSFEWL